MATDMYYGLLDFFTLHPDLAGRELYLSGESYAGKYLPYLATHILNQSHTSLNLQGILLGNGWVDPPTIVSSYPEWSYAHGLVSTNQLNVLRQNRTDFQTALKAGKLSLATDIEHGMEASVEKWSGMNAYDIRVQGGYDFSNIETFLNQPAVQQSLGVNRTFAISSSHVGAILHEDIVKSAIDLIGPLLDLTLDPDHPLWINFYTGIFDMDCNIQAHLSWLSKVVWAGQQVEQTHSVVDISFDN